MKTFFFSFLCLWKLNGETKYHLLDHHLYFQLVFLPNLSGRVILFPPAILHNEIIHLITDEPSSFDQIVFWSVSRKLSVIERTISNWCYVCTKITPMSSIYHFSPSFFSSFRFAARVTRDLPSFIEKKESLCKRKKCKTMLTLIRQNCFSFCL